MAEGPKFQVSKHSPAAHLPARPERDTSPASERVNLPAPHEATPEATSLGFTPAIRTRAEQFTRPHLGNIKTACTDYDNICSPELLTGVVYAHQLLDQYQSAHKQPTESPLPKANYDPKSLKELASDISENLRRLYFARIESQAQEDSSRGVTYDELVPTMEKMSESEIKIALAQHFASFIQQNNDTEGLSTKDIVGLAQDSVNYVKKDPEDWKEIKKFIDSPELVAFVETAYNHCQQIISN